MARIAFIFCLLFGSAGAFRKSVTDTALAADDFAEDEDVRLPIKPVPRFPRVRSSVLLNVSAEHAPGDKCSEEDSWVSGGEIARGANGKVIAVTNAKVPGQFCIKLPITEDQGSLDEIDDEITIMLEATEKKCEHVAPVTSARPCLDGERINHGAYVSIRMAMDLHTWIERASKDTKKACAPIVAQQLADGLHCLHGAGYMHGDFKADNVLVEYTDGNTGCPMGLRVADFGLSAKLGSQVNKYGAEYYPGSVHLPGGLFMGYSDPRGSKTLGNTIHEFKAAASVDWCSYRYLMGSNFMRFDAFSPPTSWEGECGVMGFNRNHKVRVCRSEGSRLCPENVPK